MRRKANKMNANTIINKETVVTCSVKRLKKWSWNCVCIALHEVSTLGHGADFNLVKWFQGSPAGNRLSGQAVGFSRSLGSIVIQKDAMEKRHQNTGDRWSFQVAENTENQANCNVPVIAASLMMQVVSLSSPWRVSAFFCAISDGLRSSLAEATSSSNSSFQPGELQLRHASKPLFTCKAKTIVIYCHDKSIIQ